MQVIVVRKTLAPSEPHPHNSHILAEDQQMTSWVMISSENSTVRNRSVRNDDNGAKEIRIVVT